MPKKETPSNKLSHLSDHIGTMVAIVTGLSTLVGAGLAACNWVVGQINAQSNQRIDQLQNEMRERQKEQEQAITRVELVQLMEHDPENVVEIEMLAKKYFMTLDGNFYMTSFYSDYAKKYGADTSFVTYH